MKLIRSLTIRSSTSHCEERFRGARRSNPAVDCRAPATLRLAVARNDENKVTGGEMLTEEVILKAIGLGIIITVVGVWAWVERKTRNQ